MAQDFNLKNSKKLQVNIKLITITRRIPISLKNKKNTYYQIILSKFVNELQRTAKIKVTL